MTPNRLKRVTAKAFDKVGINTAGFILQRKILSPFIRAVNYHAVAEGDAASFERHLNYYSDRFVSVDLQMLDAFLSTGKWPHPKPGLILSFDDGHRTHSEVVAPLLETYKCKGWFFVPIGMMSLAENKNNFTSDNQWVEGDSLNVDQLRYLDTHHIVGSHSETHCRLGAYNSQVRLKNEILGSKEHLEKVLGHSVDLFCWVGGEEHAYSREAALLISEGYKYSFMTNTAPIRSNTHPLHLQRLNIEAQDPISLVRFQLSGLMDIYYTSKRRRVDRLTFIENTGV